jgi:Putative mono-oxygenase ydhR
MIVQIVKFESELSQDEVVSMALERIDEFLALPGLLQKYYVKLDKPNQYGGIYVWDSVASMSAYRESDLAASIPRAYNVKGRPTVETMEALFQLRGQP